MRIRASARVILGATVSIGLLAMVPSAAFAAAPACGDTLTASTTLHANLDCSAYAGSALTIGANRITLNLNGHTITGPAGQDLDAGVLDNGYKKTTVTNGKILNFTYGVEVEGSSSTTVSKLTITGENDGADYGIYASNGVNNVFTKLTVSGVKYGMYTEEAADSQITWSSLTGSSYGLDAYLETADMIGNNTFTGDYGVYDLESAKQVYENNIADGTTVGMDLYCDGDGKVTATGNTANGASTYGFEFYECYGNEYYGAVGSGSHFTGNTANNGAGIGFYGYYSANEVWKNNTANNNGTDGFYLDYPTGTQLISNTALTQRCGRLRPQRQLRLLQLQQGELEHGQAQCVLRHLCRLRRAGLGQRRQEEQPELLQRNLQLIPIRRSREGRVARPGPLFSALLRCQSVTPGTSISSMTSVTPLTRLITSMTLSVSSMSSTTPRTATRPLRAAMASASAYCDVAASARSASRTRSTTSSSLDRARFRDSCRTVRRRPWSRIPPATSRPCGSSGAATTGGSIGGTQVKPSSAAMAGSSVSPSRNSRSVRSSSCSPLARIGRWIALVFGCVVELAVRLADFALAEEGNLVAFRLVA